MSTELIARAREYLSRHLPTCLISTTDAAGRVNVAIMHSMEFIETDAPPAEPTSEVSTGGHYLEAAYVRAATTYQNLQQAPRATIVVVVPDERSSWKTRGVRLWVELVREETRGPAFERLQRKWEGDLGPLRARLVFKLVEAKPLVYM